MGLTLFRQSRTMQGRPAPDADTLAKFKESWKVGLFDCTSDVKVCFMGMCCGPCLYGQTSQIVEDNCMMPALKMMCCAPCHVCCFAPARRNDMRQMREGLVHGG